MQPIIALIICLLFIIFVFAYDIKHTKGVSNAIWIPLIWLFISGSRSVYAWFHLGKTMTVSVAQAYQEGSPLDRNVMLILYIIGIFILSRRNIVWSQIFRFNQVPFYFFIYCLISISWADYPFVSFKRLVGFAGMFIMILVVLSENSPFNAVTAIMRRCSYILVSLSFLFIKYFPDLGRYYTPGTWKLGVSGVGGNKNELGMLCVISVLIFLFELMLKWNDKNNFFTSINTYIQLLMIGLTVYFLKMADSSTSTLCSMIVVLIYIVTNLPFLKKNTQYLIPGLIIFAIVLIALQFIFDIKTAIITAFNRPPDLKRADLWEMLFSMVKNPIIGTGYESFWTLNRLSFLASRDFTAIQSHNGYIDTYLNLGYIGVIFFIMILLTGYIKLAREINIHFDYNRIRLAFITIFTFYNYTEAAFPRTGYFLFFVFLFIIRIPETTSQQLYLQNQMLPIKLTS